MKILQCTCCWAGLPALPSVDYWTIPHFSSGPGGASPRAGCARGRFIDTLNLGAGSCWAASRASDPAPKVLADLEMCPFDFRSRRIAIRIPMACKHTPAGDLPRYPWSVGKLLGGASPGGCAIPWKSLGTWPWEGVRPGTAHASSPSCCSFASSSSRGPLRFSFL